MSPLRSWPLAHCIAGFLATCLLAAPGHAVERQLSLDEAIQQALRANLGLQIEKLQPEISRAELERQLGLYGLRAGFNTLLNQDLSPSSTSFIEGASILNQLRQNYNLFLEQDLPSGGNLALNFNNGVLSTNSSRVDVNPAITPQISLDLRHPLLRNTFNGLRQLEVTENQVVSAVWNLKQEAINTVAEVQSAYWGLVLFRERLRVLEQSLSILEELQRINKEKEKAGFVAPIDNLQTEARIASLQANLLDARRNLANAEDQLKQLLNPEADPALNWDVDLIPTDRPAFEPYAVALEQSYTAALKARPDYQVQLIEYANTGLREQTASQNLLPQLDFTGSAGLESLDSNYVGALGKLFSFQTYGWNLGLSFEMPVIGNPYASVHTQTRLQQQQQELRLNNFRQQIQRDLRQAVRNVEMSARQVEATRLAKRLAEEQLKAQTEKLNLGMTTNFQVLQFQTDFVQASLDEVNAIVQYTQAINQLQRSEGTLLEARRIEWLTP
ncbi:MAG: hypothetical protein CVV27_05360 [Candidatus Melainabacteria bacterium HGW-Melainabacteria-1]|nr:MAG: hypothetical protein CVV27_05360 [Candidatus Melainabacteria bacterium HGW-Melainabacteria-1]